MNERWGDRDISSDTASLLERLDALTEAIDRLTTAVEVVATPQMRIVEPPRWQRLRAFIRWLSR